jgi:hypothetical protein
MRGILVAGLAAFMAFSLGSCAQEEPKPPAPGATGTTAESVKEAPELAPVAEYKAWGSIFQEPVEVQLSADGSLTVRAAMRGGTPPPPAAVEEFSLSKKERATFVDLVRKTGFFEGAEISPRTPPPPDVSEKLLRITMDGRTREVRWFLDPALGPLELWFRPWIDETCLLSRLKRGEGLREAEQALDPRSGQLPRPDALRGPIRDLLVKTADPRLALAGFGALARMEAPGPWAALGSRKIAEMAPAERFIFAWYLVQDERATQEHRDGLLPDTLALVRAEAKDWVNSTRRERCTILLRLLANRRDEATLTAIPEMARESPQGSWSMIPVGVLAFYGDRGLDAVLALLSDPEPRARRAAAYGLSPFLYEGKDEPGRRRPEPEERARVRKRLAREVLPRIEALAAEATEDRGVRDMARDAKIVLVKGLR